MKVYFNSIGVVTNTDTTGDTLRQGSTNVKLKAYFDEKDNSDYVAKFNFTRSDGSSIANVLMSLDENDSELFTYDFLDEWFFAKSGTTTLTIFLINSDGTVEAQGQVQFNIEKSDYNNDPDAYNLIAEIVKTQLDNLSGKTLYVFGDDLLAQRDNIKGVVQQLAEKHDMKATNYAVVGVGGMISKLYGQDPGIYHQIDEASDEIPDFILLDGGHGDLSLWNLLTLGTLSSGYDAELDDTTFYGAFEKTIKLLLNKYPGARIVFVTPHIDSNSDLTNLNSLCSIIREVCNKWGIAIADVNRESSLNTYLFGDEENEFMYSNHVLKDKAYEKFYLPVIEKKL